MTTVCVGTSSAAVHDGIVTGTCIILLDDHIVYAGPIVGAPRMENALVLLSATDYAKLMSLLIHNSSKSKH